MWLLHVLGLLLLLAVRDWPLLSASAIDRRTAVTRLRCADESSQLFPLDVELRDSSGAVLFSSAAGGHPDAKKICYSYPFSEENLGSKFATAWQTFRDLRTVQYVVPASLARAGVASVRIIATANSSNSFVSYPLRRTILWSTEHLCIGYPYYFEPIKTVVFTGTAIIRLSAAMRFVASPTTHIRLLGPPRVTQFM